MWAMEEQVRDQLVARRKLNQARRQRQENSISFRRISPGLRSAGVRFSRLPPTASERLTRRLTSGPGEDEEVHFGHLPAAHTQSWSSFAERDALCRAALAAVASVDAKVAVVWHPACSGLRIAVSDLLVHVETVLNEGHGEATWIVSASGERWLIQIGFWSRTLSWAPAMPELP